jgi:esterase/lipase
MLYIKPVPDARIRLLFVMGATWHTKCMFDLDTVEDSFADILSAQGVETYAVDLFGAGPGIKPDYIGDLYCKNLEYLAEKIKEFNINCIMGYSSGCAVVKDLATQFNFDSIVLLDPGAKLIMSKQLINNDKYIVEKNAIKQALINNNTSIDPLIAKDYIDAVAPDQQLVTASYPVTHLKDCFDQSTIDTLYQNNNVKTFFTKNSLDHLRKVFPDNSVYYTDASHWVLLEPYRYRLANDVINFLTTK